MGQQHAPVNLYREPGLVVGQAAADFQSRAGFGIAAVIPQPRFHPGRQNAAEGGHGARTFKDEPDPAGGAFAGRQPGHGHGGGIGEHRVGAQGQFELAGFPASHRQHATAPEGRHGVGHVGLKRRLRPVRGQGQSPAAVDQHRGLRIDLLRHARRQREVRRAKGTAQRRGSRTAGQAGSGDRNARPSGGRGADNGGGAASVHPVHNSWLPATAPGCDKRSISVSQSPDCLTTFRPAHTIPCVAGAEPRHAACPAAVANRARTQSYLQL